MQGLRLGLFLGLIATPAMAHDPETRRAEHQQAREEYHQAEHAAQDAARHEWHARHDAAVGDYEGAAEAHRRAHEAADDASQHYHDAQHHDAHANRYSGQNPW